MEFEREKALLLGNQLREFVAFVHQSYRDNTYMSDKDQLYRLKNLVDEYKFQLLAEEILRINQFSWEAKGTEILVGRVRKGITSIHNYIENNRNGLFIFSARVYTIKTACKSFTTF